MDPHTCSASWPSLLHGSCQRDVAIPTSIPPNAVMVDGFREALLPMTHDFGTIFEGLGSFWCFPAAQASTHSYVCRTSFPRAEEPRCQVIGHRNDQEMQLKPSTWFSVVVVATQGVHWCFHNVSKRLNSAGSAVYISDVFSDTQSSMVSSVDLGGSAEGTCSDVSVVGGV